ncbi:MAG: class I SAM-dependent methyltransferase [Proteobacteria bacterium]|nr:MAG: class I SAM-dependent methyltransferase [Pseudomonadota bacterium]
MSNINLFNLGFFIKRYNSSVFFETGLGGGGGLYYASHFPFQYLFSTEIDTATIKKFEKDIFPNIQKQERFHVINSKSVDALDGILPNLAEHNSIIFWLDAHFPGEANGVPYDYEKDLDLRLPLEKELEIINKHRAGYNDVIIIDDNRIYEKRNYEAGNLEQLKLSHLTKYNNKLQDLLADKQVFKFDLDTGYIVCIPGKKRKFGIRMAGNEIDIEKTIKQYIANRKDTNFTYFEIGAAGCVTMKSIYEIIKENIDCNYWHVYGLDLVNGWSLDWNTINSFGDVLGVIKNGVYEKPANATEHESLTRHATLILDDNPRAYTQTAFSDESIDICFIDGCHGKKCVIEDFKAVESKIKKGGIVFFHDAGVPEQGTDWQGHCGENINVREAIKELGLLDNSRYGWQFMFETNGTRKIGGDGNSCVFVRKL